MQILYQKPLKYFNLILMTSTKLNKLYLILIMVFLIAILNFISFLSSFVLAQLPPGGMKFNVDPLLTISIIAREIVLIFLGFFLLNKWFKAEKRFYSDLPFLMALTTFILIVAKAYDLYLYNLFGNYDFEIYIATDPILIWYAKIRWRLILANTVPMVGLLLSIWMADYDKKYLYLTLIIFISSWTIYIFVVPTFGLIKDIHVFLLLPIILLSIITYLFLYKYKRLPEIHSLIISIAWIAYLISSILRPFLMTIGEPPWGFVWVSELMDLIIWCIMTLGFVIKPNYLKTKI